MSEPREFAGWSRTDLVHEILSVRAERYEAGELAAHHLLDKAKLENKLTDADGRVAQLEAQLREIEDWAQFHARSRHKSSWDTVLSIARGALEDRPCPGCERLKLEVEGLQYALTKAEEVPRSALQKAEESAKRADVYIHACERADAAEARAERLADALRGDCDEAAAFWARSRPEEMRCQLLLAYRAGYEYARELLCAAARIAAALEPDNSETPLADHPAEEKTDG